MPRPDELIAHRPTRNEQFAVDRAVELKRKPLRSRRRLFDVVCFRGAILEMLLFAVCRAAGISLCWPFFCLI